MCRWCRFEFSELQMITTTIESILGYYFSSPLFLGIHLKMIMENEKRGKVLSVDALSCFFETTIHC